MTDEPVTPEPDTADDTQPVPPDDEGGAADGAGGTTDSWA